MRALRRLVTLTLLGVAAAIVVLLSLAHFRRAPGDAPWAALDLADPPGLFTAGKIAALDGPHCRALLDRAGIAYRALPPRHEGATCGYDDGVRLAAGGARTIGFAPAGVGLSCRVAAGLALWEWNVVQASARQHFGTRVTTINHFGSYNCRRIHGRATGDWSEHAHANALDVAGFRLADGTEVSVARDWKDDGPRAAFLHDVRTGACHVFATVLSPDYNAAHHDHLHLDEAHRPMGWSACR